MKKIKWMTMAAVVTLSASLAFAAPGDGFKGKGGKRGRHGHGAGFVEKMAAKLNLTDAQKSQIAAINQGFRANNKAAFEGSRELRQQFREAKKANDTAKLESLKPQMDAQRTQMKQLREAHRAQILAVLTPDQRTQWQALEAERQQRRGERGPRGERNRQR